MKSILKALQIKEVNPGACHGPDAWIEDPKGKELVSFNPATGEAIARIIQATPDTYQLVSEAAHQAFLTWREVPAPKRGLIVRDLGNALREVKEPLGDLVSLEMGKIRAEGHGEVQEMIDICDFAVGLSRQLYGLSMHSERPSHRMYEQWHPLGTVGVISAFNFPVAVWSWNSAIAAVCGDPTLWKPSSYTPLTAVAVQHITNRVMADHGLSGVFNLVIGSGRDVGDSNLAGITQLSSPMMPISILRSGRYYLAPLEQPDNAVRPHEGSSPIKQLRRSSPIVSLRLMRRSNLVTHSMIRHSWVPWYQPIPLKKCLKRLIKLRTKVGRS
jgi:hypothetical protein